MCEIMFFNSTKSVQHDRKDGLKYILGYVKLFMVIFLQGSLN